MPAQRRLRTRNPIPHLGPVTRSSFHSQNAPDPLPSDTFDPGSTTPEAYREVSTEPSSPTLHTRAYGRALRRQRSARFVHAVLHYDRFENDLQPWHW
jgi:hypothetical protein